MRFAFALITALVISSMTGAHSAQAAADDHRWVTVFYQVTRDHTVTVKQIEDGAEKVIHSGKYLEAYLPRTLFPANEPVTPEAVAKISPLLAQKSFPAGFRNQHCGQKADIINKFAQKAAQSIQQNETVPMTVSENNNAVMVRSADLIPKNGKLRIMDVITEKLHDVWRTNPKESETQYSCVSPEPKVDNSNILSIKDIRIAALVASFKGKAEISKVIKWAELQVALRSKADTKAVDRSTGCCEAFVARALYFGGLTDHFIKSEKAVNSGRELTKQGFTNILEKTGKYTSEIAAPRGAILVYSGGRKGDGHIAIKTAPDGKDGYVSDFSTVNCPTGGHKLIGIYIKA